MESPCAVAVRWHGRAVAAAGSAWAAGLLWRRAPFLGRQLGSRQQPCGAICCVCRLRSLKAHAGLGVGLSSLGWGNNHPKGDVGTYVSTGTQAGPTHFAHGRVKQVPGRRGLCHLLAPSRPDHNRGLPAHHQRGGLRAGWAGWGE